MMNKLLIYVAMLVFLTNNILPLFTGFESESWATGLAGILVCAYLIIEERERRD